MARSENPERRAAPSGGRINGVGVGLRYLHHEYVLQERPAIDFLEVHAENYLSGIALDDLLALRDIYPISVHAVGLSLGSAHGVDERHLSLIAELCARVQPDLVSDHISWSRTPSGHVPDLLPLPYTLEALDVCARAIDRVQDRLGRQILVENPSRYLAFAQADRSEAQFFGELVRRTGCGILFDLNNIVVSAANLRQSAATWVPDMLGAVPANAVAEIHVAGHLCEILPDGEELRIDDHGSAVSDAVWDLLSVVTGAIGERPVLIEWDTNIPAFAELEAQAERARTVVARASETFRATC